MECEVKASFLKLFEIIELTYNESVTPEMIANALEPEHFKKIFCVGIRKCFDTLPESTSLISDVHAQLNGVMAPLKKGDGPNESSANRSAFQIESLHFQILEYLDFKCLMSCSRINKSWLHKAYDPRARYSLDLFYPSKYLHRVRNIYSRYGFAKKVRLCPWHTMDGKFNYKSVQMSNLSKFKKIKQLTISGDDNFDSNYPAIIKDILSNNSANIEKLAIEICIRNTTFVKCMKHTTKFSNLKSVQFYQSSGIGIQNVNVSIHIDEILNTIVRTATSLKNISFLITSKDFFNDKLEFKLNNDNVDLLDCVKISTNPWNLVEEQIKNVVRLLCSNTNNTSITKKIVFCPSYKYYPDAHTGGFQSVHAAGTMFVEHLNLRLGKDKGPGDHEGTRVADGLKHLTIDFLDNNCGILGKKSSNINGVMKLLSQFEEIAKTRKKLKIETKVIHGMEVSYNYACHNKQGSLYNWRYLNGPSFEQFCQICHLMHEINVNSNDHINHNIVTKFLLVTSNWGEVTNLCQDSWDLATLGSCKVYIINSDDDRDEKEAPSEIDIDINASMRYELTFEQCVKKFNKHKVAGYCMNKEKYGDCEYTYEKCYALASNPSQKTLSVRVYPGTSTLRWVTLTKDDFPTKKFEFNLLKYTVDDIATEAPGLHGKLFKYKHNMDPNSNDQKWQFFFKGRFITSAKEFEHVLSRGVKEKSSFDIPKGYWFSSNQFDTISVFLGLRKLPFPWYPVIVVSSDRPLSDDINY